MQKEFFEKFKSLGYKRNHNRKGYVFKKVGSIEFWAKLCNGPLNEGERYVEFGISTASPYPKEVSRHGFSMYVNTIYMGDLYIDSKGSLTDSWKESDWSGLESVIDTLIYPWLEENSQLNVLGSHFRERIENRINFLVQPQDKMHEESLCDAGKGIAQLFGSAPEISDKVGRFWEYLLAIYKSSNDAEQERECALNYARYVSTTNDLENVHSKHLKVKVSYINEAYS